MEININHKSINSLKEPGAPIIIVTLPEIAEAILNACKDNGIVVAGFCDNETRKLDELYCGLKVYHTPSLPNHFSKARLVIAYHNLQESAEQLSALGYDDFYSPLELLKNYDVKKYQHRVTQSFMETRIAVTNKSHESYFDKSITYLRSLDVQITTKCSLKCQSCSNLMQYYTSAKNTDTEILKSIEILADNVDDISEYRVIGGEPLMNKDWANIVNGIVEKDIKRKVFVFTNGTIKPKDEQLESFHGKDVNFYITDYGNLSRNIDVTEESLKKYNVSYFRKLADNWVDCSGIKKHNRTAKENKIVFNECCAKQLYTLLSGKLFSCPFIANAVELNAIPDNRFDYVDLHSNAPDLKQKIERLVNMKSYFPACDYCVGRPKDPTTAKVYDGIGRIEPGIQAPKPISYKEFL